MRPAIRHILFATDLAPHAQDLEVVRQIARTTGARLTLLHVLLGMASEEGGELIGPFDSEVEHDAAARRLEELARHVRGVDVSTRLVGGTDVGAAVGATAEASEADLIVLSTHREGGLRHLLKRDVARSIGRHTARPILLLPQHAATKDAHLSPALAS